MTEIQVKSLTKVLPNMFVLFSSPRTPLPRSPRASRECGVIASLGSYAIDIQARPQLEVSVKFNCVLDTV